jgi:hypothetical protein
MKHFMGHSVTYNVINTTLQSEICLGTKHCDTCPNILWDQYFADLFNIYYPTKSISSRHKGQ